MSADSKSGGGEILALLHRIAEGLDSLPRRIAAEAHKGVALTKRDRDVLGAILPAVNGAIGNAVFTIADLTAEALTDASLAHALRINLGPLDAVSCRKLGKLFARSDGIALDGLRIESIKKVRDGMLWRVERV